MPVLPPEAFAKEDASPDALFYRQPRFVAHIDEDAVAAVTDAYRATLPPGGTVLDLMGSWISHLPPEVDYTVIGHGMNEAELAANPRYSRHWTQDLNADPRLPLDDASLDAAIICVSIQYLQDPVAVLADLRRCLRPGGPVVISFSNRCFPTKAVAVWLALGGGEHAGLVSLFLREAGYGGIEASQPLAGRRTDPLWVVTGRA